MREHLAALERLGVATTRVRRPEEVDAVDALVVPGGESTTMAKLARTFGVLDPLRKRIGAGLPVLGTCAGMIMLADRVLDGAAGQETLGVIDMTVRRNAFERQVDSFEGRGSTRRCTASSSVHRGWSRWATGSRSWPGSTTTAHRAVPPVGSSRSVRVA